MTGRLSNTDRRSKPLDLRLISSRAIASPDSRPLAPAQAREALFRANDDRFVLYVAGGDSSPAGEERVILLDLREALIWLNEAPEQRDRSGPEP
jgi:hypothetical protein